MVKPSNTKEECEENAMLKAVLMPEKYENIYAERFHDLYLHIMNDDRFLTIADVEKNHKNIVAEAIQNTKDTVRYMEFAEQMFVLTNDTSLYGAGSILNTDILEDIALALKDDLWLIPSSIHEFIIRPVSFGSYRYVSDMICSINQTDVVNDGDILGNHPYKFSRETRQITF